MTGSNPVLPILTMTEQKNYAGGHSFDPKSPKLSLYKTVINNLLENTYYASDQEMREKVIRNADKVADEDPEFVLKLAAYARQEMGLRDVPQLLLAFSANDDRFKTKPPEPGHHQDTMVRDYVPKIVRRMDETITVREMNDLFDGGDPWCLRRGVEDTIKQIENEYILGKYSDRGNNYNIRDVYNWCHPDSTLDRVGNVSDLNESELEELHERLMMGDLDAHDVEPIDTPSTWRSIVSENGSTKEAWREAVQDMGHMAKIMNLRNMLEAGLSTDEIVGESDLEDVSSSNMFPFRYYSAYRVLKESSIEDQEVYSFLEEAVEVSTSNIPDSLGRSIAVADTSGSMSTASISGRSDRTPHEIAAFFASVLNSKGADVAAFAEEFEEIDDNESDTILGMTDVIQNSGPGGMTNAYKVLKKLCNQDRKYDRVILLTDDQFWNSTYQSKETVKQYWDEYSENIYPKSNLYNVDLSAYGSISIPEGYKNVYRINGWNSRIIDYIQNAERPNEVIRDVEAYDPF